MKNSKIKTAVAEEPKQTPDNVFVFPTIRGRSRHSEIRAFLSGLLDRHDECPAVAVATVAVREDGSVSISAKGIDADTADDLLVGTRQLARRIETSKSHYPPAATRQRGGISLLAISSTAFAAASYLNAAAWLDVVLVLAAQASAILLTTPTRR
ncbi:hypothetical protein [Burkholderia gladioli]|uniref:hypothetical protein n=1 Tax=Burkholderia gladioli TaxID=28095 RepID=UPI00163E93B4|nr:hypothetical protein [Burkholderia gladioli]